MDNQINDNFTPERFIKGKIVEVIFDQMYREVGEFTILPFGYERTLPELAQYSREVKYKYVLENVKNAPDFVLLSNDRERVFMAEVKYRSNHTEKDLIEIADKIQVRWNSVWLFLATPNGFYFDSCTNILKNGGEIIKLSPTWVPKDIQEKYLKILHKFIK